MILRTLQYQEVQERKRSQSWTLRSDSQENRKRRGACSDREVKKISVFKKSKSAAISNTIEEIRQFFRDLCYEVVQINRIVADEEKDQGGVFWFGF